MSVNIRIGVTTNHLDINVARKSRDPEFVRLSISWSGDHGFIGEFEADSMVSDFSRLASDLGKLYRNLGGSCDWSNSYEQNVQLEFVGDGRGHFEVKVELIPDHLFGPWVRSKIDIDQTQLPEIISSAEEAARV